MVEAKPKKKSRPGSIRQLTFRVDRRCSGHHCFFLAILQVFANLSNLPSGREKGQESGWCQEKDWQIHFLWGCKMNHCLMLPPCPVKAWACKREELFSQVIKSFLSASKWSWCISLIQNMKMKDSVILVFRSLQNLAKKTCTFYTATWSPWWCNNAKKCLSDNIL